MHRVNRRPQPGARFPLVVVLALVVLAWPGRLAAKQGDGWVGKRVIQKSEGFSLKLDKGEVERSRAVIAIYRIERVDGTYLWLHAPGLSGRALSEDVVSVDDAIDDYTRYLQMNPNDSWGYLARAQIWQDVRNDLDFALADYNEAVRLDADDASVYCNRANVWVARKDYDRAIADYDEAVT